jgi:hypothetical protein
MALVAWIIFTLLPSTLPSEPVHFFVSIDGNDTWSGRRQTIAPDKRDGPFRSLERVRDEIRKWRTENRLPSGAVITIKGGTYFLDRPFELTKEDSGRAGARIIYRAAPGERVLLSAGRELKSLASAAEAKVLDQLDPLARDHVAVISLPDAGITDWGDPVQVGMMPELFLDGVPLPLARWPNEGFTKIDQLTGSMPTEIHGIKGDKGGKFTIADDRIKRWVNEKDLRVHGYWFWDWSAAYMKVAAINPESKEISLADPQHGYGYRTGQRFYVLNALSELDQPGEWYIDREDGKLYLWPLKPLEKSGLVLSVQPRIIESNECSFVELRGLSFEACRGNAVSVTGGESLHIVACRFRDIGGSGVSITGMRHAVVGCDLSELGESGISINGGDRTTLTSGEGRVENNLIHHYGRIIRTYAPAIGVAGVGMRIAHNLVFDAPHCAILLHGNDHVIEFNEIHHVCQETGDVGAFYMGRDWSMRGNVVRHNYFHHIKGPGLHGAMSVYLDDAASGTKVFGNVFYKAGRAVLLGGGRDNIIENNVFVDCEPSIHVDARGLNWMKNHIEEDMPQKLKAFPYQTPPWSDRYPELISLLNDDPGAPKGNVIERNISVGGRWLDIEPAAKPLVKIENNLLDSDPHFLSRESDNFQLRDDSPAYKLGFERIPLELIGLVPEATRASWPPPKWNGQ